MYIKYQTQTLYISLLVLVLSMLLISINDVFFSFIFPIVFLFNIKTVSSIYSNKLVLLFFCVIIITIILNSIINLNTGFVNTIDAVKILLNSFASVLLGILFYTIGRKSYGNVDSFQRILLLFNHFFFVNAALNLNSWIQQTGGVVGRYNFISPLTLSVTGYIYLSVIGFFLTAFFQKNTIVRFVYCLVFLSNIIIIVNRQQQLLFVLYLITFISFSGKVINTIRAFLMFCLLLVLFVYIASTIVPKFEVYSSNYTALFTPFSDDVLSRKITHEFSVTLFRSRPLIGIGYGMFSLLNRATYKEHVLASSHSGFYDLIAEFGYVGILMVLFLYFLVVKNCFILFQERINSLEKFSIVIVLGSLLSLYFFHLVILPPPSHKVYYIHTSLIWFLIGFIDQSALALRRKSKLKRSGRQQTIKCLEQNRKM